MAENAKKDTKKRHFFGDKNGKVKKQRGISVHELMGHPLSLRREEPRHETLSRSAELEIFFQILYQYFNKNRNGQLRYSLRLRLV